MEKLMIQGNVPISWKTEDYVNVSWRSNENHYNHIDADAKNTKQQYGESVGVYICNDVPTIFMDIANRFGLKKSVVALNKMTPGQILPWHVDKYPTYIKRNNISDDEQIMRIILFLHNQEPGQQLWIKDKLCVGLAGTYYGWGRGVIHMAANLSVTSRYTLQITGVQ